MTRSPRVRTYRPGCQAADETAQLGAVTPDRVHVAIALEGDVAAVRGPGWRLSPREPACRLPWINNPDVRSAAGAARAFEGDLPPARPVRGAPAAHDRRELAAVERKTHQAAAALGD